MKIGELFMALGFKVEGKEKLDEADKSMESSSLSALKATLGVGALAAAFYKMMEGALQSAVAVKNFVAITALSREELKQWQLTAEQNDVSAEELTATIEHLQATQAKIRLTGEGIAPFQALAVNPFQSPFQVLKDIRKQIVDMDPAIARTLTGMAGISDKMFVLLRNSNLEFDKLDKHYITTDEEQGRLIRLNRQWKEFLFLISSLKDRFASLFTGAVSRAIDFFLNLANAAMGFAEWLNSGTFAADNFKAALTAIGVVAASVAAFFFPITAAIGGLLLVIEDLYVYSQGGKSLFGDVIAFLDKNFPNLTASMREQIRSIRDEFSELFENLKKAWPEIEQFAKLAISGIALALDGMLITANKFLWAVEKAWALGRFLGNLGSDAIDTTIKRFEEAAERVDRARQMRDVDSAINSGGLSSGKIDVGNTALGRFQQFQQSNDIQINVDGSQNPAATADAVHSKLQREIDDAYRLSPLLPNS